MARDWESTFSTWYQRASDSEQTRYEDTCKAINEALRDSSRLNDYTFDVYAKGSYPAFTNVVRDSDVDIAAELTSYYATDFIHDAEGLTIEDVGTPYTGNATLPRFKDDVEGALTDAFGAAAVQRGNKAIHIRESTRSLKADVVPCVTHNTWLSRRSSRTGIKLRNDARPNQEILNYPKQHLDEGTKKNDATSRRYKRVVRILKRLENEMVDKQVIDAVPSFLIESAVYNVPNSAFTASTWTARVENALTYVFNGTKTDDCIASDDWLDVNRCKYLFASGQAWTYETANTDAQIEREIPFDRRRHARDAKRRKRPAVRVRGPRFDTPWDDAPSVCGVIFGSRGAYSPAVCQSRGSPALRLRIVCPSSASDAKLERTPGRRRRAAR